MKRVLILLLVAAALMVCSAGCTIQGPLINVDLRPPAKVCDDADEDDSLTDMVEDLVP